MSVLDHTDTWESIFAPISTHPCIINGGMKLGIYKPKFKWREQENNSSVDYFITETTKYTKPFIGQSG